MQVQQFLLLGIPILFSLGIGYGDRTKDKMYQRISGFSFCFRKMNGTHQIGCSSERQGSTGVIHFCENKSDLNFLFNNGTAPPYIPVIPTNMLSRDTVNALSESGIVSGLLIYKSNETVSHYTHENTCPNTGYGLSNTCEVKWNPYGTGLLYVDIPFPIFYIDDEEDITAVKKCFKKFNDFDYRLQPSRSLCSLQLKSFMYGTTNTETCMRRTAINKKTNLNPATFCEPLGDQNIWSSLFPLVTGPNFSQPVENYNYIIIAARLDTTSMFFERTAGATSPVTGLITLLATAKLLKTMLPRNNNYGRNILFVIFNGETYDYLGSQRFLYDMLNEEFPIKREPNGPLPVIRLDDIELFIELSQLSKSGKVVAHFYKGTEDVMEFTKIMNLNKGSLNFSTSEGHLPPASLQTFLKNHTLNGLVLADHEEKYVNHFYNSLYDNATNIEFVYYNTSNSDEIPDDSIQSYTTNIANMTALSVYKLITGEDYHNNASNLTSEIPLLVNELYKCYLEDSDCKVNYAIQGSKFHTFTINMYVGVASSRSQNLFTSLVGLTLGWLTADDIGPGNVSTCVNKPRNYAFKVANMSKGINDLNNTRCFRMTFNLTEALSPAFIIPDYDWSSGLYSSWSESAWNDISVHMFLKPAPAHEVMTLSIGTAVFMASLMIVYFVNSRSHIIFNSATISNMPTDC